MIIPPFREEGDGKRGSISLKLNPNLSKKITSEGAAEICVFYVTFEIHFSLSLKLGNKSYYTLLLT